MSRTATWRCLGLVLAVALVTTGCAAGKPLPEYTAAVDETNAAIREIADLVPTTTEEAIDEGSPFTCGNALGPNDPDTPVFYTGTLTLDQSPDFDPRAFIAQLPARLPAKYDVDVLQPELDEGTSLYLRSRDGEGPTVSIYADEFDGQKSVFIRAMSRCAKPEPPEVASEPLPDYETVREESFALSDEIVALLPGSSRPARDGFERECEEMVDPFTGRPPVRHVSIAEVEAPDEFDDAAFITQLPALLGDDFEVLPPDLPDGKPTVELATHRYGGAALKVVALDSTIDFLIVVYSRCAEGLPPNPWHSY